MKLYKYAKPNHNKMQNMLLKFCIVSLKERESVYECVYFSWTSNCFQGHVKHFCRFANNEYPEFGIYNYQTL